jgi:hypothetical protein
MPHPPALDSDLQTIIQQFPSVFVPAGLNNLLEAALSDRPLRPSQAPQFHVPFPIFVEFPASFDGYGWDVWLRDLLVARLTSRLPQAADLLQVVRLSPGKWTPREAPSLPLRFLAIGPASHSSLEGLINANWYGGHAVVQTYGLSIQRVTPFKVRDSLESGADLVIVDALHFPWLLSEIRRLPFARRPRLVITLDVPPSGIFEPLAPAGVAQLRVPLLPWPVTQDIVREFLYGIIHDQPLHEATKTSQRLQPPPRPPLRLTANPRTNQGLRISDALGVLADEITQVAVADLGGLPQLLVQGGMTERDAEGLVTNLREIVAPHDGLIRQAIDLQSMTLDFVQERSGLQPMAEVKSKVVIANEAAAQLRKAVHSLVRRSSHRTALRNAQERRVDIAIQELEREVSDPFGYVRQGATLLPGRRYRVRVRIGRRTAESLMISEPPPLDPLLPAPDDAEGHRLQVVFFSKEFEIVGSAAKPLLLPVFGPSEAVFFELLTPTRNGSARLRVAVYHGNHLLQSFVLNAWIGTRDESHSPLGFALEFSRTAKFANIEELGPRAVSIGVNSDSLTAAATHSLHVKSDEAAYSVTLTEKLMADQVAAYRTLLSNATRDGHGNARFDTYPEPGAPIPPLFHEIMREFAEFGTRLHNALFMRLGRAFRDRLRTLASSRDEVIQVVRFDPNFVFPWAAVYDFPLPTSVVGAPPPEVCPGVKVLAGGGVGPCGHTSSDEIYCINGFWGVRHILEELIAGDPHDQDAVTAINRRTKDRAIRFAVDEDEPHTVAMRDKLSQSLGSGFAMVRPEETLLDLLWQEDERPAVLIVLGHLEKSPVKGEPPGIRIVLPGGKSWLRADDILKRVKKKEWEQPCTLVMLMGCETALTELGTLTDFVTALQSARAGAVVGTECVAFSRLLARFATEVTLALWQKTKLGQAVTEFRRLMLRAGNPLAFVFQAIGGTDVHLALGGEQ